MILKNNTQESNSWEVSLVLIFVMQQSINPNETTTPGSRPQIDYQILLDAALRIWCDWPRCFYFF